MEIPPEEREMVFEADIMATNWIAFAAADELRGTRVLQNNRQIKTISL